MKKKKTVDITKGIKTIERRKLNLTLLIVVIFTLIGGCGAIFVALTFSELRKPLLAGFLVSVCANFFSFPMIFLYVDYLYKEKIRKLDDTIIELKESLEKL